MTAQGFTTMNLPTSGQTQQQIDPDIDHWGSTTITDPSSGTLMGQEASKSWFGNWLTVRGGETKTITLTYQLPFAVQPTDHYSLLWQKQPGSVNQTYNYELSYPSQSLAWQNFATANTEPHRISTGMQPLEYDQFLGLILTTP